MSTANVTRYPTRAGMRRRTDVAQWRWRMKVRSVAPWASDADTHFGDTTIFATSPETKGGDMPKPSARH